MPERWVLERAGITNVYQYAEETLRFAGGRLLLRGVNGSGKSTAMNMLLPFLLEADTRRIDAAGEQSGVLRSWMLAGRDEHQPVGYLWIELRRGDEHLAFGCGIRANRSTDRVTTWWFLTERRPGIDLALVEGRVPLSVEALRATLGSHAVFSHEQRSSYRREVRSRLFGGIDIDQHIRLLHVVRNPRVGDRIDVDLPLYLQDALPQLSEAALDDAAQPLEDLEEHRRNVEDLTRTATALDALGAVYATYVRGELESRMTEGLQRADAVATQQRAEATARRAEATAKNGLTEAVQVVTGLEADEVRLRAEIAAVEASELYAQGAELTDLRAHVDSLAGLLRRMGERVARDVGHLTTARDELRRAAEQAKHDQSALAERLTELDGARSAAGLTGSSVDGPGVTTVLLGDADSKVPDGEVEVEAFQTGLAAVRAAAQRRAGDVEEVRHAVEVADRAEAALRQAEERERSAKEEEARAVERMGQSRQAFLEVVGRWRDDLTEWVARLLAHRAFHGLAPVPEPLLSRPDLGEASAEVIEELVGHVDTAESHHREVRATLAARREIEQATAHEDAARLAELEALTVPEPAHLGWQQPRSGPALADLVDFAAKTGSAERANLEAAMEASGLLAAEVAADGTVVLGQLTVGPAAAVTESLAALLVVTVPDGLAPGPSGPAEWRAPDPAAVAAVLAGISTRESDLEAGDPPLVVTAAGGFRAGTLRGRHTKEVAEHIGVTARRASLDRQRAAAAAVLADARRALEETDARIARADAALVDATEIRRALPSPGLVLAAIAQRQAAEDGLGRAQEQRAVCEAQRVQADRAHGEAMDATRRLAANSGLPPDRAGLDRVKDAIRQVIGLLDVVTAATRALARSVKDWAVRGAALLTTLATQADSEREMTLLQHEHEPLAMKLATLEDSVGLPYQELQASLAVSRQDLSRATASLAGARSAHTAAVKLVTGAERDALEATQRWAAAEARCVAVLPDLRNALAVPGLLAAAVGPEQAEPALPAVTPTPEGVRQLIGAVQRLLPETGSASASGDSVRQSLRQRRDTLGAGWDAEDRQPDPSVPMQVEVTGPLGRMPLAGAAREVRGQLHRSASLLSTKQDQALRNLLQGLIAREVAEKLHAARELVKLMNRRLDTVATSHGIGVSLRWKRKDDLGPDLATMIDLLAKPPDLRTVEQDEALAAALSQRIAEGRATDPEASFRVLIGQVLDYRSWHRTTLVLHRPGQADELLSRRTALSEGEKKMVSYLALFAAVAASCDAFASAEPTAPRFVLLDDAFSKVSEDNHPKLFGLLVELDLDFIATSERLWGTHASVPELAISEVIRDASLGVIVLQHSRWDGRRLTAAT